MAYFPNGTSGDLYEAKYCSRCIHNVEEGCPVMLAHVLYSYEECNNPQSILHILIPRDEEGWNLECKMFVERSPR